MTAGNGEGLARFALVWIACAAISPAAFAQTDDDPVLLDHYDELQRVVEGDSLTYFLRGNVRAHRSGLQMRSEEADVFRRSGIADFRRSVHIWDATIEIYADRVIYYSETDIALATGRVQMIDLGSGSQVTADTVHYDRVRGTAIARPRPHAVLISDDSTAQGDPFDVWADEMRFHRDSTGNAVIAVREVLIERSDLTAVGDSLHYDRAAGRVALRIGPQVETAETFLTAERIDLVMDDSALSALIAVGGARTVEKADSLPPAVPAAFNHVSQTSFLEGDSIHITFVDDGIDDLLAVGNARSLNYGLESPPGPIETWSVNYLIGHRLRLKFMGDTVERVTASGGHRGVYRTARVRVGGPEKRPSEPIPLLRVSVRRAPGKVVAVGGRSPRLRGGR